MFILTDEDLAEAVDQMRAAGTDLSSIEVKAAVDGLPRSFAETISSFSNTGGGPIILGIREKGFEPVKGIDIKTLQSSVAHAAREQVSPAVSADIRVLNLEGLPVLVANIPEASIRDKPVYVRKSGMMNGSFIRTGDGDHHMTVYEIDRFIENQHRSARNDMAIVRDATLDDFDRELLAGWLLHARDASFGRMDRLTDEDIMTNRRVIVADEDGTLRPTVAGILALGNYPQKFFPRLNVTFTSYASTEKGSASGVGRRYADAATIDGPIPDMIVSAVRAVSRNIRHGAIVKGALREDVPDYPLAALREAIANALMHRDLSDEGTSSSVLVELFPDRLVIRNPGGLFASLTTDQLGRRGTSISRNQYLARILEDVPYTDVDGTTGHVVENRGTGYPTIFGELERALMVAPLMVSTLDEFSITFFHRRMTEAEGRSYSRKNTRDAVLAHFASHESASTAEVARAAGISTKTARSYIKGLMAEGSLEPIGSQYSPQRRYRLAGK